MSLSNFMTSGGLNREIDSQIAIDEMPNARSSQKTLLCLVNLRCLVRFSVVVLCDFSVLFYNKFYKTMYGNFVVLSIVRIVVHNT